VSLLAPFSEEDVTKAIQKLRIFPLFAGYRDKPPMDISALAKAAVKLGDFACSHHDRLRSVDMNPVMVMSHKNGVVAVDAIVELL
jgi:hypothetical protein